MQMGKIGIQMDMNIDIDIDTNTDTDMDKDMDKDIDMDLDSGFMCVFRRVPGSLKRKPENPKFVDLRILDHARNMVLRL